MRADHNQGLEDLIQIVDLFFLPLTEYNFRNDKECIDYYNKIYLYNNNKEVIYTKQNGLYIVLEKEYRGDFYD